MASRSLLTCLRNGLKNQVLLVNLSKINHLNTANISAVATACQTKVPPTTSYLSHNKKSFHQSSRLQATITIESPAFAESIKEGDVQFVKQVGDSVEADECIAKVETDKTTMDIFAPEAGVIESFLVEDGSTIAANQAILTLTTGGAAPAAPKAAAPEPVAAPVAAAPVTPVAAPTPATLPQVPSIPSAPASVTQISQVPVTPLKVEKMTADPNKITGTRAETRVKMSKMRKTVASRLKDAQNTTAMLTTFNEINMGNLVELRKTYGDAFLKKHNLKLGFMSAFLKASAFALQDQPTVNAGSL